MITLHESNITTFPQDNGIGVLRDVIRAYAEEELNGMFEFYMEYDSEGHLVDELKEERIIKAKAQDKLGYQLFRIYSITKHHENDNLIIRAQHITYDLANNFVEKMEANRLTKKQVMELIGSSTVLPHPFNVTSSNTTTRSSTKLYRTNPLQMIGGIEGSVLQIWGGQIERDNFNLILHDRRGSDDGVKVTYEKNITGLTAEFDIGNLVTRIFPFVYIEETDNEPARLITVSGKYIDSPLINNYEKIYIEPIDYSNDERINTDGTDAQIRQQLTNIANQYFSETGNDKRKATMEVQFEHLWETEEYKDLAVLELVGMGDTVTIEHSRLKVDATAIVNYIRYDCIAEKNEEVRLGSVKARLTDNVNRVVDVAEKVEQAQQTANQAIRAANGKNTIYYGPDEPEGGIEGDLWFRVVDGEYTRTYRHDGIQWQLVLSVDVRDAIDEAQQARDRADDAVNRANQATQQANTAITKAQEGFNKAQENALELETLGLRFNDVEGNLTTISGTVEGLQTTVSDVQGNVSNLTQLSTALQSRLSDAEGNINTLTQTVDATVNRIENFGTRNYVVNSDFSFGLDNWIIYGNADAEYCVQNVATNYRDKMTPNGLELRYEKGEGTGFIVQDLERFPDSDKVTLSFYVYQSNVSTGYVRVYLRVNGNKFIDTFTQIENVRGQLFRFTHTFDLSDLDIEDIETVRLYINLSNYIGAIWFQAFSLVKGDVASDWEPSQEDKFSQYSQLSDAINLRVAKGDVINQINLDTSGVLIGGDKILLDGNVTVTGQFKVGNANITSIDAGKITSGTLDAGRISVINLSANSIVGGILQSQNNKTTFNLNNGDLYIDSGSIHIDGGLPDAQINSSNRWNNQGTFIDDRGVYTGIISANQLVGGILVSKNSNTRFNLNTGQLTMQNAEFVLDGGATIRFRAPSNNLTYSYGGRRAGIGFGNSVGGKAITFVGHTRASDPFTARDSSDFHGFVSNAAIGGGSRIPVNTVVGQYFRVRNNIGDIDNGFEFNVTSYAAVLMPLDPNKICYLGVQSHPFTQVTANEFVGELRGSSSRELKKNIKPMSLEDSLQFIKNTEIVSFNWKRDKTDLKNRKRVGFIIENLSMDNEHYVKVDDNYKLNNIVFMQQQVIQYLLKKIENIEKN